MLVDLERVSVGRPLAEDARRAALARLNRIGGGVTATDRWRFLRGYAAADAAPLHVKPSGAPGRDPVAAEMREVTRDVVRRMPELRRRDARRAIRNCTRENWFFGRFGDGWRGHFRRRAHAWDADPVLESHAATELARRVLADEPLAPEFEVRVPAAGGGLALWRECNGLFQSGAERRVPLLYVRRGRRERIVLGPPRHPAGVGGPAFSTADGRVSIER